MDATDGFVTTNPPSQPYLVHDARTNPILYRLDRTRRCKRTQRGGGYCVSPADAPCAGWTKMRHKGTDLGAPLFSLWPSPALITSPLSFPLLTSSLLLAGIHGFSVTPSRSFSMPVWVRSVTVRLYSHPVLESMSKTSSPCLYMCREQIQCFDSYTRVSGAETSAGCYHDLS